MKRYQKMRSKKKRKIKQLKTSERKIDFMNKTK